MLDRDRHPDPEPRWRQSPTWRDSEDHTVLFGGILLLMLCLTLVLAGVLLWWD